jgi:hypothetical protein
MIHRIKSEKDWNNISNLNFKENDIIKLDCNFMVIDNLKPLKITSNVIFDGNARTITYFKNINISNIFELKGGIIRNLIIDCQKNKLQKENGILLTIIKPNTMYGLIEDIKVQNLYVLFENSGGLIGGAKFGHNKNHSIIRRSCVVNTTISSNSGGLVYYSVNCYFENCYFSGRLLSSPCAGLSLKNLNNKFKYCYTNLEVTNSKNAAFASHVKNVTFDQCFSTSKTVNGSLVKQVCDGNCDMINCYINNGKLIDTISEKGKIKITDSFSQTDSIEVAKIKENDVWFINNKTPLLKYFTFNLIWSSSYILNSSPILQPNNVGIYEMKISPYYGNNLDLHNKYNDQSLLLLAYDKMKLIGKIINNSLRYVKFMNCNVSLIIDLDDLD